MDKSVNHYRVDPAALAPVVAYVRSRPYEEVVGLLDGLQAGIEPVTEPPIDDSPDLNNGLRLLRRRDLTDDADRLGELAEQELTTSQLLTEVNRLLRDTLDPLEPDDSVNAPSDKD